MVFPPGDTLLETIDARGMSQAELAARMGVTEKHVSAVVKGKSSLSEAKDKGTPLRIASFSFNLPKQVKEPCWTGSSGPALPGCPRRCWGPGRDQVPSGVRRRGGRTREVLGPLVEAFVLRGVCPIRGNKVNQPAGKEAGMKRVPGIPDNYHLKEVYESGEVDPEATIRNFRIVRQEGSREFGGESAESHGSREEQPEPIPESCTNVGLPLCCYTLQCQYYDRFILFWQNFASGTISPFAGVGRYYRYGSIAS